MYIKHIALSNFRCFRDLSLDFSKITLLTGPNSSGKSSAVYALLAVFQSTGFPFALSLNGPYVNMGDFCTLTYNNSRRSRVGISLTLDSPKEGSTEFDTSWGLNPKTSMPRLVDLRIASPQSTLTLSKRSGGPDYSLSYHHRPSPREDAEAGEFRKIFETLYFTFEKEEGRKRSPKDRKLRQELSQVRDIRSFRIRNPERVSHELSQSRLGTWLRITDVLSQLLEMSRSLNFISSFRLSPERTYYQRARREKTIGSLGENTVDQIHEWQTSRKQKMRELTAAFRRLGLLDSIHTRALEGGRFEVSVKVRNDSIWAPLTDVGFGISQFMPVLAADLQQNPGSTLIVAQPEIHLHPSAQAALADYFMAQVRDKKKHYVIETHSEYLLNRVRLAIARGKLQPSDVALYYFENGENGSVAHSVGLQKDGTITNAPKSFFTTYMMDVMDIALSS